MEETLKFFSNFQQYTPYFLNKEYIITKEIRYRSDSSTTTDTQSMSVNDIFSRISENDGKFVCKHTGHLGQYRLTIDNFNIYINTILENRSIAHMLVEVLETASVAVSIENAFLCTWYYYDDDCTPR